MSITFAPTLTGGPTVNLADGNAAQVLDLLGLTYDGDYGDTTAADDKIGRPAVVGRHWIDWERRPGYLAEKLELLHEIATWAHHRHVDIRWS